MRRALSVATALSLLVALPGCAWVKEDLSKGVGGGGKNQEKSRKKADLAASKVTTIGVNAYLWRATLETLSFMPLVQADSNGGVIVTDWYSNPNNPGERMKLTVSVLLAKGCLRLLVFRLRLRTT